MPSRNVVHSEARHARRRHGVRPLRRLRRVPRPRENRASPSPRAAASSPSARPSPTRPTRRRRRSRRSTSIRSSPRRVLGVSATAALFATSIAPSPARANDDDLEVVSETAGFGAKTAKTGDLVLVNYVATVGDDTLVDTTYGGEKFFTNGAQQSVQPAEPRPVIVRVNGTRPGSRGSARG